MRRVVGEVVFKSGENLLERALVRLDDKYDGDSVEAVRLILAEHFAALDIQQGTLQNSESGIGILLLDENKLITIEVRIATGAPPSVNLEVRALSDVVISLETSVVEPSARRERRWRFSFPDSHVTEIAGSNDELEQFAQEVAARAGTRVLPPA